MQFGFCSFVVCTLCLACVMNHVSMLRSGVCPSIWHLSFSVMHGASVAPGWNPMRSSLMVVFGSFKLFLK